MKKSPEMWVQEIHENAVAHGWWKEDRDFGEICALVHSELSEALEEYRNARPLVYFDCPDTTCDPQRCADVNRDPIYVEEPCDRKGKPEGIAVELADVVIRIFDYFGRVDYVPRGSILYPAEFMRELGNTHGVAFNEAIRAVEYRAILDIEEIIAAKHEYNKSRPYRHGGKIL